MLLIVKMDEKIIYKRKVVEYTDEKELENYQAAIELAIENH